MDFKHRKGIILAGGSGTRLSPMTKSFSKQLLPIYDKPMIYYPLCVLMYAGIREILIITTPKDKALFIDLLGYGGDFGIEITYETQDNPDGIAKAFLIGEKFINSSPSALILGDNIFHGSNLLEYLKKADSKDIGATVFACRVKDPERYGVLEVSTKNEVLGIEEKPINPKSNIVVTGLYFYDSSVVERAKKIRPSQRGELEITDINKSYLEEGTLNAQIFTRGMAWLDTGTCDSFNDASNFIRTLENRQGLKVCCPEEVAWRNGWIDDEKLLSMSKDLLKSGYGDYLRDLIENN